MTILVTGATGNVGRHLVTRLAGTGHHVRALTRDPARAAFPEGVEVVRGDLAVPETVAPALEGVTGLHLITFGGDDYAELTTGPELASLAAGAGVRRITVLAGDVEESPVEKALRDAGLPFARLAPVEFMANALSWADQVRAEGVVRELPDRHLSPMIHEADIADVAAVALTEDGHGDREYWLTGPEALTMRDKLRILGEAVGREIELVELTVDQARERWRAEGYGDEDIEFFLRMWSNPPEEAREVLPTVEEVTGRPARTFAQWARENAAAFRP
ncbi:SDR family oxidoreductase [Bailinhaonella thermotolerans]|uniref:NAD-dependent epimerase/dehydratase family protein n=1 Tax=Bailinhaonella thermotolerans TaxID=1070861 RepID=A0A3A4B4A8_9ACTN|nr:NmrA family NAD(P)-binding protein [Bailinhaonella thermotolerans]RJL32200.1 NAD-dependent epimerase/dehydratase family protein [Bailinhaonella thermotolerans]